jgi:hypothetical protein
MKRCYWKNPAALLRSERSKAAVRCDVTTPKSIGDAFFWTSMVTRIVTGATDEKTAIFAPRSRLENLQPECEGLDASVKYWAEIDGQGNTRDPPGGDDAKARSAS